MNTTPLFKMTKTKQFFVFLLLTSFFLLQVFAAENKPEYNMTLAKKMEDDYKKAILLERKGKKLDEAIALLEKYDGTEPVPDKLKDKILNYKTWAYSTLNKNEQALETFQRYLDLTVPNGYNSYLNLSYGSDPRHKIDLYTPKGDRHPTPVLVMIHGGGWGGGNQNMYPVSCRDIVKQVLSHGGAVASITYRFVYKKHKLPAPLVDSARAIQWLRANADKFNLDEKRFVAMGNSAGGCNTLWLATHDDLADPDATDPILRESTRLSGAIADSAQTTLDPVELKNGDILEALSHSMFSAGLRYPNEKLKACDVDEKTQKMIDYCSPVKHLDANDPPIFLRYNGPINNKKDGVHHCKQGLIFKKKADEVGAKCTLHIRHEKDYPSPPQDFILDMLDLNAAKK